MLRLQHASLAASQKAICQVAIVVGTPVARCPPHRPGRALISASGSYLRCIAAEHNAPPHTPPPVGHAQSALSRVRVEWKSVLLDPQPSLLTLRRRWPVFVRMIHRYYAAVRSEERRVGKECR